MPLAAALCLENYANDAWLDLQGQPFRDDVRLR